MKNEEIYYSDEVNEVLSFIPGWMIRWGTTFIFIIIILIIIASWFIQYPDVLSSRVVLTTQNPPVALRSFASGKITNLQVEENQLVTKGELVAVIENTAQYEDVMELLMVLDTLSDFKYFDVDKEYALGSVQQYHASFIRLLKSYHNLSQLNYYTGKTVGIEQQIRDHQFYIKMLKSQITLLEKGNDIAKAQFDRSKVLFETGSYSKRDFEDAEKAYLQQHLSVENQKTILASTQMKINQLKQEIVDLKTLKNQDFSKQSIAIEEAMQNLKSQLKHWEQLFLIKSPINGIVAFTQIWSVNQHIQQGELVATIIPNIFSKIIGKIKIPSAGVGKIKINQDVNIQLDNYPYREFGLLRAKVKSVSLVPEITEHGTIYTVEIKIPNKLTSNYGKELKFAQNMTGVAEIITEDIRLLERFLSPLRSILKKYQKKDQSGVAQSDQNILASD